MAAWCFKTATRQTRSRSTHHWYWQIDTAHALLTSPRLFSTLDECVTDARLNGFRGAIAREHDDAAPAAITVIDSSDASVVAARAFPGAA